MMKRIVAGLFVLLLVLVALVLVVPNFIDWNKHKDTLAVHASAYMQRDVVVGGDISFRLLPNPQLSVSDVSVASIEGARQPHLLKLKQLDAKIRFKPLLEGRIEIEKVHLVGPELTLEILDDKRASWHGLMQGDAARKPFVFGQGGSAVKLEDFTLQDGRIRYIHPAAQVDGTIDNLNLAVSAPSLQGPYKIVGAMMYQSVPVNVEISTGQANKPEGMRVTALFQPTEKLPQVKFAGHLANAPAGMMLDGDLTLEQGPPAALLTQEIFSAPAFMHENMQMNAVLSLRPGSVSLKDIQAEVGKQGRISGEVSYTRADMPTVDARLHLKSVPLGLHKNADMPKVSLSAQIALTGEDVTWRGMRLRKLDMAAASQSGSNVSADWDIKKLHVEMADKTAIKLAGKISPQTGTYNFLLAAVDTPDLASFGKNIAMVAPEAARKILPHLPAAAAKILGNLDIRQDRASFYNFTADLGLGGKLGGVVNMAADTVELRVNLSGIDPAYVAQGDALLKSLFTSGVDMDISIGAQKIGDIDLRQTVLKASTKADGVTVEKFAGMLGDAGAFDIAGTFASWPPQDAAQAQINFEIKAPRADAVATAAGFVWPYFMQRPVPVDMRGQWNKNGSYHMAGNVQGGMLDMQRSAADAPVKFSLSQADGQGMMALLGMDIDRLVSPAGAVQMTGEISGDADNYKIDSLRLAGKEGVVTGQAEKKNDSIRADLRSDTAQFDRWLASDMRQAVPLHLKLRADTAQARGLALQKMQVDMTIRTDAVDIRTFEAGLWDGTMHATGKLRRGNDKTWTVDSEGNITALRPMKMPHGIAGITADEGDVTFTLSARAQDNTPFKDVSGDFSINLPQVTLAGFDPAALAVYLTGLKGAVTDAATSAHKTLRSGSATYRDISADFVRQGGIIQIKNLTMQNASSTVKTEGRMDAYAGKYDIKALLTLKAADGLEPLAVTRAGDAGSAPDYRLQAKQITDYAASRAPPPEPESVPAVEPVVIDNPVLPDHAAEMLPPGYLNVPAPSDEKGEDLLGDVVPVEAESLPAPAASPDSQTPENTPASGQGTGNTAPPSGTDWDKRADDMMKENPEVEETIRGILDRLED